MGSSGNGSTCPDSNVPGGWGSRPTGSLWGVGKAGGVFHLEGQTWSREVLVENRELTGIFVADGSTIWVSVTAHVEEPGLYRFDGRSWSPEENGPKGRVLTVTGTSASDVWALERGRQLWRWNGVEWAPVGPPFAGPNVWAMAPAGPAAVWVVGSAGRLERIDADGTAVSFREANIPEVMRDVHGNGAGELWMVGDAGVAWRRVGGTWERFDLGTRGTLERVRVTDAETWVLEAGGRLRRFAADAWSTEATPLTQVRTIDATPSGELWAGGDSGGVAHRANGVWTVLSPPFESNVLALRSVGGHLWAAGAEGGLARWDGSAWTQWRFVSPWIDLTAIDATGPDDAVVTSDSGDAYRLDGANWSEIAAGTSRLWHVRIVGPGAVWLLGPFGGFVWNGTALEELSPRVTYNAVWKDGETIWVVTSAGVLISSL